MHFIRASLPFLAAAVSGAAIESRETTGVLSQFQVNRFTATYEGQWITHRYNFNLQFVGVSPVPAGTSCTFTELPGITTFGSKQRPCLDTAYEWSITDSSGGSHDLKLFYTEHSGTKWTGTHSITVNQIVTGSTPGTTLYNGPQNFNVNASAIVKGNLM